MAAKEKPDSARRYHSVSETTEFLGVSKVHMYRILKDKGPDSGVYRLKGKKGAGSDLIRIDLEKFLLTQSENHPAAQVPAEAPLMDETMRARIKIWMVSLAPIRTEVNDLWEQLERFYDQLAEPEAGDKDERPQ